MPLNETRHEDFTGKAPVQFMRAPATQLVQTPRAQNAAAMSVLT